MLNQPPNIYDKLDALRGESEHDLAFWRVLTWGMSTALILVAGWYCYKWLMKKRALEADRRSRLTDTKRKNTDLDAGAKISPKTEFGAMDYIAAAAADRLLPLKEIPKGTRVALFWNVGEMRCGSKGLTIGVEDGQFLAEFDSESAPTAGDATLICPEAEGHVLYYRVRLSAGSSDKTRSMSPKGPKAASRVHHRYRAHANLRAAALRQPNAEGVEQEAILLRIQDLAFDGVGLLSEVPLNESEALQLRLEIPDYLEPLILRGRVAWAQSDASGLWRGGLELEYDNVEQRLMLADYLLTTIRAESGEIILEKRRRTHTPVRPIPLEPTT